MHKITPSQTDLQTIRFAPIEHGVGDFLLQLVEEGSDTTYLMLGYGIRAGSYQRIIRTFPGTAGRWYMLRVWALVSNPTANLLALDVPNSFDEYLEDNTAQNEVGQCVLAAQDPYTVLSRLQANTIIEQYFASGDISEEVYRGKVLCTDQTDLQKYSGIGQPFTEQPTNESKRWMSL